MIVYTACRDLSIAIITNCHITLNLWSDLLELIVSEQITSSYIFTNIFSFNCNIPFLYIAKDTCSIDEHFVLVLIVTKLWWMKYKKWQFFLYSVGQFCTRWFIGISYHFVIMYTDMNHCMWITCIQFTCEHKQATCMCTHVHTKFTRMWCTWLMYMCCIEHVANLYCIFRYIYVRMYNIYYCNFLNQACTGLWQMHTWLLKI